MRKLLVRFWEGLGYNLEHGCNIVAPPGNQAANREDKLHPIVWGVPSLLKTPFSRSQAVVCTLLQVLSLPITLTRHRALRLHRQDEVLTAAQPYPDRLRPWKTIALAIEKSTEAGHQANSLVE